MELVCLFVLFHSGIIKLYNFTLTGDDSFELLLPSSNVLFSSNASVRYILSVLTKTASTMVQLVSRRLNRLHQTTSIALPLV